MGWVVEHFVELRLCGSGNSLIGKLLSDRGQCLSTASVSAPPLCCQEIYGRSDDVCPEGKCEENESDD